jgi:hypothetical protein
MAPHVDEEKAHPIEIKVSPLDIVDQFEEEAKHLADLSPTSFGKV